MTITHKVTLTYETTDVAKAEEVDRLIHTFISFNRDLYPEMKLGHTRRGPMGELFPTTEDWLAGIRQGGGPAT